MSQWRSCEFVAPVAFAFGGADTGRLFPKHSRTFVDRTAFHARPFRIFVGSREPKSCIHHILVRESEILIEAVSKVDHCWRRSV